MFKWLKRRRETIEALENADRELAYAKAKAELASKRAWYSERYCPHVSGKCVLEQCVFWRDGILELGDILGEPLAVAVVECKLEG